MPDFVPTLTWGGQPIGSILLFSVPMPARLGAPIEQDGLMRSTAALFDPGASLIYRIRTIVFQDQANIYEFNKWLIKTARMMQRKRADLVETWEQGSITYPLALFSEFDRPQPSSQAEARFSDAIAANFVTDQDPAFEATA